MNLKVYARREPSTDSILRVSSNGKQVMDVQIYRDRMAKEKFARFPWWSSSKPTRRNKYVTVNCYKWRLVWI